MLDNVGSAGGGLVAPTDSNGGTGTTAYYTGGTADLTSRSYTVSEMFLRAAGTAGNRPLQIGFGNNSNLGFNGANGLDFFSARVDANAATGQDALCWPAGAARERAVSG